MKHTKKWGHPLSWLVIGDGNSTSVYNDTKLQLPVVPWTEIEPHTAITNQPEESKEKGEKTAIENKIRKVTWNSKILKNKSNDSHRNFLVMFSSSKASRAIGKKGMAHWRWPQFMMTHEKCSTYST